MTEKGRVNNANVNVTSNKDTVTVVERGRVNNANVTVSGSYDRVTVDQYGRVNSANVTVTGSGDTVTVVQLGRFNSISAAIFGSRDFVGALQVGDKNRFPRRSPMAGDNVVPLRTARSGQQLREDCRDWQLARRRLQRGPNRATRPLQRRGNLPAEQPVRDRLHRPVGPGQYRNHHPGGDDPPRQGAAAAASAVATVFRQAGWAPCGDRPEHSARWCKDL